MRIGMTSDHAGFELKQRLADALRASGHEIIDYGPPRYDAEDDYPDYVAPLGRAVATGEVARGVAICGSGVGASVAANKIRGVRAGLCHDSFSARQGVEDDDMNVLCLGSRVVGLELAKDLAATFLQAQFSGADRHVRRVRKIEAIERESLPPRR